MMGFALLVAKGSGQNLLPHFQGAARVGSTEPDMYCGREGLHLRVKIAKERVPVSW